MDDETKKEIVIDALESVIRDSELHVDHYPTSHLIVISTETHQKILHALRLFEELDEYS